MTRVLPPRPSLEQLKKQAKDLRKAHRSASSQAAERIVAHLPRLSSKTEEEILKEDFSLQEAQHVIACEYGCRHWEMLCSVVAGDLNLLTGLSNQHMQMLLRQIDQTEVVGALNGAGAIVTERFYENMSLRVQTFIGEEIEWHRDMPEEERLAARHTILSKAIEMAGQGQIAWPDDGSVTGNVALADMDKAVALVDFNLLAGLADRDAQTLLGKVDQKDLIAALVGAPEAVCERFLISMSPRVRGFIESEIEASKAAPDYVQTVRRRILLQAGAMAARGMLRWPDNNGSPPPPPQAEQYEVPDRLLSLIVRPLENLSTDERAELWMEIARQALKNGILSLQPVEERTADPFLREALQLLVDGTDAPLLRDLLETRLKRAILPQQSTRCAMIVEAVMSIQSDDHPTLIRHKMGTIYLAESESMLQHERRSEPTVYELTQRLQRTPVAQMSLDQVDDLLTDLGWLAHNESIDAFSTLPRALEGRRDMASETLRDGLEMMLAGTEPDKVMDTLEWKVHDELEELEKTYRTVIEAAMGIQAGKKPEDIAAMVRSGDQG